MMNRYFDLHIHSVTPIHIADASSGDAHINAQGQIRSGKVPGTLPVTRTERRPILVNSEITGAVSDAPTFFPYIKSNNLVGRLRREAQDILSAAYIDAGETMSDKVYRGLSCGATSGTPSNINPSLDDIRTAKTHIYMGIFGGGDAMHPSGWSFPDLNVKHDYLLEADVLTGEQYGDYINCNPLQLTAPVGLVRRDRMFEMEDVNLNAVLADAEESTQAWLAELGEAKQAKADETAQNEAAKEAGTKSTAKKASRAELRNLVAYEVALAGLGYQGRIYLENHLSDAQLGMIIECISRLARKNALGGKGAKGLGRFNLELRNETGTVLRAKDGKIIEKSAFANQCIEALDLSLDALDYDVINQFFAA